MNLFKRKTKVPSIRLGEPVDVEMGGTKYRLYLTTIHSDYNYDTVDAVLEQRRYV